MNIYLKNIKELIERRIELGPVEEANYLSSVLKNKRTELKLTLSETTENICSEAFLSKVERNLMDPRNDRVELLCERLNLDYYTLVNLESNNRIEKLLYYYFEDNYDAVLSIEDKMCDDIFIAQDEIIKSYKALINKDFKTLHFCVINLDNVKDCLSDIELFALMLVVFEYYLKSLKYTKALDYINLLEKFNFRNEKCIRFLKERRFILNCKMESSNVSNLFDDLRQNFPLYSINKQIEFIIYFNETLSTEESYDYLCNLGNNYVPEYLKEEYNYAKNLVLTKLNKNVEAMKSILESNYYTLRFITLFAYNLYFYSLENKETNEYKSYRSKLISLLKIASQNNGDTYHIAFLRLMQYELDNSSKESICNYIKNQLLKELKEYSYPLYDDYIKNRYCVLLGSLCRYKDAYLFLLESKNHLKK